MAEITTYIHRKIDPPIADLQNLTLMAAEPTHFIILEGGMESGKTSVMIIGKSDAGIDVTMQMSADMFNSLAAATIGAEMRFKDKL